MLTTKLKREMINVEITEKLEKINLEDEKEVREIIANAIGMREMLFLGYEEDMVVELLEELKNEIYTYPQDGASEIADSYVEVYTSSLFELYSNNLCLMGWVEEAEMHGMLEGAKGDLVQMMQRGQYSYNSYILHKVLDELDIVD